MTLDITKVEPYTNEPSKGLHGHEYSEVARLRREVDKVNADFVHKETQIKFSLMDAIWYTINHPSEANLFFTYLSEVLSMKSWKTTLSAAIGAAVVLAKLFGLSIPDEVVQGIVAAAVFFVGLFAKDSNVTGGDVRQ